MNKKIITLDILDKDYSFINKMKRELYFETNNPSFNLLPCFTILGETNLSSFKNINLRINNPIIEFEKNINNDNHCIFINSINNDFTNYLKEKLCLNEISSTFSQYFSLTSNIENYPLIYLGCSKKSFKKNIPCIIIKDIRLNIIELKQDLNKIEYKKLASIHLSKDKNLLSNNLNNSVF